MAAERWNAFPRVSTRSFTVVSFTLRRDCFTALVNTATKNICYVDYTACGVCLAVYIVSPTKSKPLIFMITFADSLWSDFTNSLIFAFNNKL